MNVTIPLSTRRLTRALLVIVLLLTLAHLAHFHPTLSLRFFRPLALGRLFDLHKEANIPSWFSSSMLLLAALLLAVIASAKRSRADRFARHWGILSAMFVFLSMDEAASVHEMSAVPLRLAFHTRGIFYFAWVIPGLAFVAIFALAYARFVWNLPRRTRVLFLAAGIMYVGGALGMEMVGGLYERQRGRPGIGRLLTITTEEVLEMLGVVMFIYALLAYMRTHLPDIHLHLAERTLVPNETPSPAEPTP